jgi:hypothetical protein
VGTSVIVGIVRLSVGGVLGVTEINSFTFISSPSRWPGWGFMTLGVPGGVSPAGLPLAHWIRKRLKNPSADRLSEDEAGHLMGKTHGVAEGP